MGLSFNLEQSGIKRQKEMSQFGRQIEEKRTALAAALEERIRAGEAEAEAQRQIGSAQVNLPERRRATDTETGGLALFDLVKSLLSRTPARSRVQEPSSLDRFDALRNRRFQDALLEEKVRVDNELRQFGAQAKAAEVERNTAIAGLGQANTGLDRTIGRSEFAQREAGVERRFSSERRRLGDQFSITEERLRDQFEAQEKRIKDQFDKLHEPEFKKWEAVEQFWIDKGAPPEEAFFRAYAKPIMEGKNAELAIKTFQDRLDFTRDQAKLMAETLFKSQKENEGLSQRLIWDDAILKARYDNRNKAFASNPGLDRFEDVRQANIADAQRRIESLEKEHDLLTKDINLLNADIREMPNNTEAERKERLKKGRKLQSFMDTRGVIRGKIEQATADRDAMNLDTTEPAVVMHAMGMTVNEIAKLYAEGG